jgi:hypothetical protein
MNKSTSLAILILGLLSLQCGLQASPAIAGFIEAAPGTSLLNLSMSWMTVGVIGVLIGGVGIFWRRLL